MGFFRFIIAISLLAALALPSGGVSAATGQGTINDVANIRESAGFSRVLRKLAKGAKVSIVGEKGDWYRIADGRAREGWVSKKLVDAVVTKKAKTAAPVLVTKAKAAYAARIRKDPEAKGSNIIAVCYPGEPLIIEGEKGDWYSVSYKDKKGWVAKELLVITGTKKGDVSPASYLRTASSTSISSSSEADTVIPNVSSRQANDFWLKMVNKLRGEKGLRELVTDDRFVMTASEWSGHMKSIDRATHERSGGESMHEWVQARGLEFAERGGDGGWKDNFFSENIAYQMNITPDSGSVEEALASVLKSFIREGEGGVHYRTIYHPDWNSVGVGMSSVKDGSGRYTSYFTFHYGSLVLNGK